MLRGLTTRRLVHIAVVVAVVGAVVGLALTRSGVPASAMRLLTGDAWLANASAGTVSHVNGYSGDVDSQVSVAKPGDPFTVVQFNGGAYELDLRTGRYVRIGDSGLNVTTTASTKARPAKSLQLAMGSGVLWSIDTSSGVLQRLNAQTLKPIGRQVALAGPTGSPAVDGSGSIWVPVPSKGAVVQVTPGRVVSRHTFGHTGDRVQVAVTSGGAWAVDPQREVAASLSVPGAQQVKLPGVGSAPLVAASSASPDLAVVSRGRVFDVNTNTSSLSSVVLPTSAASPTQVVVSSNRAYVLAPRAHLLDTVDLSTAKVASSTPVPAGANQLIAKDNLVFVNSTTTAQALVVSPNGSVTSVQKYQTDHHKKVPTTVPKTTPSTVPKPTPSTVPVTSPPTTAPSETLPTATLPPPPVTAPPTVPLTVPPPVTAPPSTTPPAPPAPAPTVPTTAPSTTPPTLPPPTLPPRHIGPAHPAVPPTTTTTTTTTTTVPPTTTTTVPSTTTTTEPATTTTTTLPPTVPGMPAVTQVAGGDGQLTVSWTAPASDGGSAITSYEVTGSPTSASVSALPSATSATLTGLTNGTSECVQVQAINKVGGGPLTPAGQSCATPNPPPAVPGAVSNLSVAAGNQELTVSWSPATVQSGSPAITGYELKVGSGTPEPATSPMTLSKQTAWSSETISVYAVNSVGDGTPASASGTPWERSKTVTCYDDLSGDHAAQNTCGTITDGGAWSQETSSITWINAQPNAGGHKPAGSFEGLCTTYSSGDHPGEISGTNGWSGDVYGLAPAPNNQPSGCPSIQLYPQSPDNTHVIAAVGTSSLGPGSVNICIYKGVASGSNGPFTQEVLAECGTAPIGLSNYSSIGNFWT